MLITHGHPAASFITAETNCVWISDVSPQLDCCGAQEYLDWTNVTFSALHDVPDSCCLSSIAGCGRGVLDLAETEAAMKIHTGGCLDIFTARIQDNVGVVGGVGIGIGLLQANMIIQFVFFGSLT